jgi:hypothetical protein
VTRGRGRKTKRGCFFPCHFPPISFNIGFQASFCASANLNQSLDASGPDPHLQSILSQRDPLLILVKSLKFDDLAPEGLL